MATTTNYGWTTPDDTALVKDGASAIRTLGTSVDTTTKNLNPQTTLGDIAYRSSTSNVNTRLGIGSTSQVLTVSGGVPVWATPAGGGGMTLLSTTTLSGASTTISGISGSYVNLVAFINGYNPSTNADFLINPNAVNNLCNFMRNKGVVSTQTSNAVSDTNIKLSDNIAVGTTTNAFALIIYNYASSTAFKPFQLTGFYEAHNNGNTSQSLQGAFRSTTAISSLEFVPNGGTISGGTVLLYGVK